MSKKINKTQKDKGPVPEQLNLVDAIDAVVKKETPTSEVEPVVIKTSPEKKDTKSKQKSEPKKTTPTEAPATKKTAKKPVVQDLPQEIVPVKTDEVVSFDKVVTDSNITIDDSPEGLVRAAIFKEGLYEIINPIKVSVEDGIHIYELPIRKHAVFLGERTMLMVNETLSEVVVTTGKTPIVEPSTVKIAKKDVGNAVRLAVFAHMENLLDFGTKKYKSGIKALAENHDKNVADFFKDNQDPLAVLHFAALAEEVYQKSTGLSNSQLTKIADSYAHYEESMKKKDGDHDTTSAMLMGRALHCLLFTPTIFDDAYAVNLSVASGSTNEGKFKNLYFDLISIGKEVLSIKEHNTVTNGHASFMRHPTAPLLLKEAAFEESFYTMVEDFLFRGRLDCYVLNPSDDLKKCLLKYDIALDEEEGIVLDLKFTNDNNDNEDQYSGTIARNGYHRQGSAYCSLVERKFGKKCTFILLTIESKAPYDVSIFSPNEAFMEMGGKEVKRLLTKYKKYQDNPNLYKGRIAGVKKVAPPHWYMQKYTELYGDDQD